MSSAAPCFACGSAPGEAFFEVRQVPTHCNLLHRSQDEARRAPLADIRLVQCPDCGLIFNDRFEFQRMSYAPGYETSLHFSGTFQAYAEDLARRLVETYDLRGKHVVEIGCGRGDFLRLLCELGGNQGTGFDPSSARVEEELPGGGGLRILAEPYDQHWPEAPVDLVVSRHVLEHLDRPGDLLRSAARGAAVFCEVPNALFTLREGGIWDILYEHCSYFSPTSLVALFRRAGLEPQRVEEVYGRQFTTVETGAGGAPIESEIELDSERARADLADLTKQFRASYREKFAQWTHTFEQARCEGRRMAVWGAGTKGVTFLNNFSDYAEVVAHVVDRNPNKRGRFVPGTGHRIVAPRDLVESAPQTVVVMNPLYADEVRSELVSLGIEAEMLVG